MRMLKRCQHCNFLNDFWEVWKINIKFVEECAIEVENYVCKTKWVPKNYKLKTQKKWLRNVGKRRWEKCNKIIAWISKEFE